MPNAFGEPATPNDINAKFNPAFTGGAATWKAKIRAGITQWSNFGAITYNEVGDDGSAVDPFQTGSNSARFMDVRTPGIS